MSPFTGSATRTPDWQHLRCEYVDGVATVTLARPEKLNALTFGAYADLRDMLAELSREKSVRALVLAGEGYAIVPACAAAGAPTGVVLRPLRDVPESFDVAACWRRDLASPLVDPFVAVARAVCGSRARS